MWAFMVTIIGVTYGMNEVSILSKTQQEDDDDYDDEEVWEEEEGWVSVSLM